MVNRKKYEWSWGRYHLSFGDKTLIMGVINVTPDSFSDGGRYYGREEAIARGESLAAEGADMLDIGGESTRPFSQPLAEEEERTRIVPVIRELAKRVRIPISVDTYKAGVAAAALDAGAALVNDVSALRLDPAMTEMLRNHGVPVILMHMQGTPRDMQSRPHYGDLLTEVHAFLEERLNWAEKQGLDRDRIMIDPGIGFGKNLEHNCLLIKRLDFFSDLDCPLLIGTSRKSFIGKLTGQRDPRDREWGTAATTAISSWLGAHVIRVHQVDSCRQVLQIIDALREAPAS
jgi:dihydropteroate synthase